MSLAQHISRCTRCVADLVILSTDFSTELHSGPDTSIDKVLLATAEQRLYDTVRDLLPGTLELDDTPWRSEFLYSRAATIYGGTAEIQRNIIARRLLDLGKE